MKAGAEEHSVIKGTLVNLGSREIPHPWAAEGHSPRIGMTDLVGMAG